MWRVSWSRDKMCVKDTSDSLWWCPAWTMLPAYRLCRLRSPFHIQHLIFTGALCNNEHKMVMAEMCSLVKGFVKPACGLVPLSRHDSFYGYIFSAESKGRNWLLFICHFFVMNWCSGKISGVTNNINCVPVGLKLKQLNRTQQFVLRFFYTHAFPTGAYQNFYSEKGLLLVLSDQRSKTEQYTMISNWGEEHLLRILSWKCW